MERLCDILVYAVEQQSAYVHRAILAVDDVDVGCRKATVSQRADDLLVVDEIGGIVADDVVVGATLAHMHHCRGIGGCVDVGIYGFEYALQYRSGAMREGVYQNV